jgi:hypothetical protein
MSGVKRAILMNVQETTEWLKAGIWKLRGIRRGFERGRYPLVSGGGEC